MGILPLVLIGPFYLSYHLWIAPIMPNYWSECLNHSCPHQQFVESLAVLYVVSPEVLVVVAAMVCGYIGIKHWPRYPTEQLTLFNLSLTLGALWAFIFGIILGVGFTLAGSTL